MAYTPVPGAVLVALHWQFNGSIAASNSLHCRNVTSQQVNQGFADAVGATVKGLFVSTQLNQIINSSSSLVHVGVRDLATLLPVGEYLDAGGPSAGTTNTGETPSNLALCVSLRTANAGRSFRGRYYQGGFDVADIDPLNGHANALTVTRCKAFIDALNTTLRASHGLQLAIVSRQHNKAPVNPPAVYDVLSTVVVDSKFDHVDRRKQ